MFLQACTIVRTDAGQSESFEVKVGLYQGSVLSPLLFAAVTQSSKVRDLGVIFDQFLNFNDHITTICRSILLLYDACSTIIHALISCRLDYCNSILYNV